MGTSSGEGSVVIRVRDDGNGIPADQQASIFDVGFTTSEDGHGLGLAIVQRFVEAQGGSIEVESRREWGTEFKLTFPVSKENQ